MKAPVKKLALALLVSAGMSGLLAQPVPPPPLPGTIPAPAATGAEPSQTTPSQAEEMLQALRRAMTNPPPQVIAPTSTGAPIIIPAPPVIQAPAAPNQTGGGTGNVPSPAGAIAPGGQGSGPVGAAPGGAQAVPAANEVLLKASENQFNGMPLLQFLETYGSYSGKTIFRASTLQGVSESIYLQPQSDMTLKEMLFAMESVLQMNGVALIPVPGMSEKFVRAVPKAEAASHPGPFGTGEQVVGENDQFITQVIDVKSMMPSELAPLLATFTTTPNSITPFDVNGTLLIRDLASSVRRMMEVVARIDVLKESGYRLEVIPIKYGKVVDFYNIMASLVSGQSSPVAPRANTPARGARAGIATPLGARGAAAATPIPAPAGAAQANFQQQALQALQNARQALGMSPTGQILEDARIVPDERNNKLVVYANKRDMEVITKLVEKLDVALAQVLIEAVIMQVQIGDSQTLGTSMIQRQRNVGRSGTTLAGGINSGQLSLLSSITNFSTALPSGLSYFGTIAGDVDFAVQAIATDNSVNVLSRPRIQTSHAIPGSFSVTEDIPFISGIADNFNVGGGTVSRSTIERLNVGIQLDVTPYITPDGLVVMEIAQNQDERGADVIIDNNPIPSVLRRSASSTLTVRSGQAILLGGYITDQKNTTKSGVPILKDIPLLGVFFRSSTQSSSRSELIILLQARVLDSPEAAARAAEEDKARLPAINELDQQGRTLQQRRTGR